MITATQYRQGDVLLVRVEQLPDDAQPEESGRRVILGTGRAHALDPMLASLYTCGHDRFLVASPGATLVHEEHGPIELPVGVYRVVRQRKYSPAEISPV